MKARRHNVSDEPQTSRRLSADELLSNIPIDLVIDIFSRLPLESIARCRCVSKRWASVLRRPDFTDLFSAKSLARPQLLFACRKGESELIFFSLPQRQNLDENVSSLVAPVAHHMNFPFERVGYISDSVNGYVCITEERKPSEVVWVICNPSTRQCFTLPKVETREMTPYRSFFGYDPVEKHHKVLAMFSQKDGAVAYRVLTLRGNNGNMAWRLIECDIQHSFPRPECICINGVLYYIAKASSGADDMIVCFDVRYEKFSFVKTVESGMQYATLINFQGKLASVKSHALYNLSDTNASLEMWILEDPEEHEWSKRIFNLPPTWKDVVAGKSLYFEGVTATNEFFFSEPFISYGLYYVYYYNFDKKTITRVEVQGMGARESGYSVFTYLNHVEDVKLM